MNAYVEGRVQAYDDLVDDLRFLTNLYPGHIDTEDNHFFRPVMKYFSETEQQDMLDKFFEFDKGMIHAKYEQVVAAYEQKSK
jgi:hemerythrin-like domain-containing protein